MWKFVEGTDNKVIITSDGRVFRRYSVNKKRPEKGFTGFREVSLSNNGSGYLQVSVGSCKTALVHKLVARAFIPNPLGLRDVDHIDGDKTNNRIENLRWVSHRENCNNPNTRYKNVYGSKRKVYVGIQGFNPKTNHRTPVFKDCREASAWITPEGKDIKPNGLCNCLSRKITYRNYYWTARLVTGEEYQDTIST